MSIGIHIKSSPCCNLPACRKSPRRVIARSAATWQSKEALNKSARAVSERFCSKLRFENRRNTMCISRFSNRKVGTNDPLSAAADLFRASLDCHVAALLAMTRRGLFRYAEAPQKCGAFFIFSEDKKLYFGAASATPARRIPHPHQGDAADCRETPVLL